MTADPILFRDLAYVFGAALLGGALARLARQPLIVGYVLGGILIGPFTPGPTISDAHTFELFAEIGVVLLMFSIGIEFALHDSGVNRWQGRDRAAHQSRRHPQRPRSLSETGRCSMKIMLSLLVAILSFATAAHGSVGFQRTTVTDSDGTPREVGIWYPSDAPASSQPLGPHRQTVAPDGALAGRQLPLIVLLHGVQGSFENHYDTALALAEAGFVVAAVAQSQEIRLVERPRHVARVLDYMLAAWPSHGGVDPTRIGVFGYSVGGFTALVAIGGIPDLSRIPSYCAEFPDRVCGMLKERNVDTTTPASAWVHDARIKAAVVAAPTLGFTFGKDALAPITAPIQLWRAGSDEITPHPRHAEAIYNALPTKPEYEVITGAGHFAFLTCSAEMAKRAPVICQDGPDFDRQAFHRAFNVAVVGFFKKQLPTP
jgi:predicted dienelactone hydrolase